MLDESSRDCPGQSEDEPPAPEMTGMISISSKTSETDEQLPTIVETV